MRRRKTHCEVGGMPHMKLYMPYIYIFKDNMINTYVQCRLLMFCIFTNDNNIFSTFISVFVWESLHFYLFNRMLIAILLCGLVFSCRKITFGLAFAFFFYIKTLFNLGYNWFQLIYLLKFPLIIKTLMNFKKFKTNGFIYQET